MKRRTLLTGATGVAASLAVPAWSQAGYPNKPIKVIVPYAAVLVVFALLPIRKLPHPVDSSTVDFPGPRRCPCESPGSPRARSSTS